MVTGFTLPKLLWIRDHEPDHFAKVRQILLPKDYIRFKLTGEFATDVSDASGTSLFDVARRRWSEEMVGGLGLKTLARTIHPYPTQAEALRKVGDAYNRTRLTPLVKALFAQWLAWTQ